MDIVNDMKSMSFGDTHDYYHKQIGFNYRMTNSQAEMALKSLNKSQENIIKRESIKNTYSSLINKKFHTNNNRKVCWVYDIKHPNADKVVKILKEKGINARHSFKPMTLQPMFKQEVGENSLYYSKNVFYLHIDVTATKQKIEKECQIIEKVLKEYFTEVE